VTIITTLNKCFIIAAIILTSLCPVTYLQALETSPAPKPKHVVAIFVFKEGIPFTFYMEESLRSRLTTDSSYPIKLDVEHADRTRFPEKAYLAKIVDLYKYKYRKKDVDRVLAFGDGPNELMLEYGRDVFGDIPMVLVNTEQKDLSSSQLNPYTLLMEWGFEFGKTRTLIHDLFPQTKKSLYYKRYIYNR